MLTYFITPSSIEAAESPDPADRSEVDLRISSSGTGDIQRIDFVIPVPLDSVGSGALPGNAHVLTRHPERITPVSGQIGRWGIRFIGTRVAPGANPAFQQAVFRATPILKGTATSMSVGGDVPTPIFFLRGVEVADQGGDVDIIVEDLQSSQATPATQTITVIRTLPGLRIERFTATGNTSGSPVITATEGAKLSWVTKGAGSITLHGDGLSPKTGPNAQTPFKPSDQFPVKPQTTTTYTLVAGAGTTASVSQQVTVTVTDKVKTRVISNEVVVDLEALLAGGFTQSTHQRLLSSAEDRFSFLVDGSRIGTGVSWQNDEVLLGHWFVPISGFEDLAKVRFCFTQPQFNSPSLDLVIFADPGLSSPQLRSPA